jgi:3-dehydroquinate synthase
VTGADVRRVEMPGYAISIGRGLIDRAAEMIQSAAPNHRVAIITDDTVRALYSDRIAASFPPGLADGFSIPAGEQHKTRESWMTLTDAMLDAGFGRDTTVVALGGGVVGDLAGFIAATFMRGVPVVQMPTTLLAMIDASIGGKTGVDVVAGKNLVGAFHHPSAVIADLDLLRTLPERHWRAGLAEAIKHGVVADAVYFDWIHASLSELLAAGGTMAPSVTALVSRSVEIKAAVVRADERERGRRQVLNFGHTLGHALETESGYEMLHGEAIAIGMVLESRIAERVGVAERGIAERIRVVVKRAGLPDSVPASLDTQRLLERTRADKKSRAGAARYALPKRIGGMAGEAEGWSVPVDDALAHEVIEEGRAR